MILNSYLELPVKVEFDYHPGCPEKLYGENVHPEKSAEIEITKISYKSELIDTDTIDKIAMAQIEKEIWAQPAVDEDKITESGGVMIIMTKKYRYENGELARILCTDGFDKEYPVVSMTPNGQAIDHTAIGLPKSWRNEYQLIEITPYTHIKDGDRVMVWNDPVYKHRRIFSRVSADGKPCAYLDGTTKWTGNERDIQWDNCVLAEDEE